MGKLAKTERERVLGRPYPAWEQARRASCRRGPLSVPPTAASSDHLLVFPGTLPNPGICPPPRMPKPLASASPCTGLQAGLASARVEGQASQAGARPAGVCCRVGMGRPGLGARRQWGKGVSTPCLVSRPLPASLRVSLCPACMPGCFPAVLWDPASSWLLRVFSAGLAWPCWLPAPLAARAEPTSLVTACQT